MKTFGYIVGLILALLIVILIPSSAVASIIFYLLALFGRHYVPVGISLWGFLICTTVFGIVTRVGRLFFDAEGLR